MQIFSSPTTATLHTSHPAVGRAKSMYHEEGEEKAIQEETLKGLSPSHLLLP